MDFSKIFINGIWQDSSSEKFINVYNPASNTSIALVPACNEADLDKAIVAAKTAYFDWSEMNLEDRLTYLNEVLYHLRHFRKELIKITISELGSPLKFTQEVQVDSPLNDFHSFLECGKKILFEESHEGYSLLREPVGVVACICPWNYPLYQLIQKVIPALICGNTVIFKPASLTPLSSYYFAEAIRLSGLPKGVFNFLPGNGSTLGKSITRHQGIDMVSFTGSTEAGKNIAESSASSIKKIALELGGKSPCLILESANLDLAVNTVLNSCFLNSGQTCSALTRMYIPRSRNREIIEIISSKINSYLVGNPCSENSVLGPLSSPEQVKIVNNYIELGIREGAKLLTSNQEPPKNIANIVLPSVFINATSDMRIAKEEIFGPILTVIQYDDIEKAIEECNNTLYGLSSCVFGEEKSALKIAKKIRAGNVHINNSPFVFDAPFGGYKQSGIGRESGMLGILEFTEVKAIFH